MILDGEWRVAFIKAEHPEPKYGTAPLPTASKALFGSGSAHWTLSVGLERFRTLRQVEWNLTMAATLLVMAPVIVVFFLAQKAFVEGITLTGLKG